MMIRIKNIILLGLTICTLLLEAQDTISVYPLNFNTNEREFAPIYYKNGLVFCGINTDNEALTYLDNESGKQMTDIFFVPIENNKFGERVLFNSQLQTSFHDGPITFSDDSKTAYFTRSRIVEKKLKNKVKQENNLGVYKATYNGTTWENITPCSFNSEVYNIGQPSISKDGTKLYVVSDKDGGFGGKDLYSVEIKNGEFGDLINLGSTINSEHNEMFPYISSSNNLYFSSDKPGGMGGLDIYSFNFNKENAAATIIKDTVINTPFDDFSIIFNETGNEGYFSSNRLGSDDIFKINIAYPEFSNCEEIKKEILCYEFFEEATLNADSVMMVYQWDFGDGSKEENLEVYHCYDSAGSYIVRLNIMDPAIDKVFVNQDTYELEILDVLQPQITIPDTIYLNTQFTVNVKQGKWSEYDIDNVYIDYGDSTFVKNDFSPHSYKNVKSYEFKVLISGFDTISNNIKTNCFYKTIFVVDISDDYNVYKPKLQIDDNVSLETIYMPEEKVDTDEYINNFNTFLQQNNILDSGNSLNRIEIPLNPDTTNENKITFTLGSQINQNELPIVVKSQKNENSFYAVELITSEKSISGDTIQLKLFVDIVSELFDEENNLFSYTLGKTYYPIELIDYYRKAHELGFNNAEVKLFSTFDSKLVITDVSVFEIDEFGEIHVVLNNIYFEYENYQLTTQSKKELDRLIKYLNTNQIKIEIGAHTDNKGDEFYNLKLSIKRAESVKQYLQKNKISSSRLFVKGYGESSPIAPNTDNNGKDNPIGRSKNRRITFKIL